MNKKSGTNSPDYETLLEECRRLEAESARQIVVQQELIEAKGRIDRELSRSKVLQDFVNSFLSAGLDDDGITLTLEFFVQAFEFEICMLLCPWAESDSLEISGQFGLDDAPATLAFDNEWLESDNSVIAGPDHAAIQAWRELDLAQVIFCPYYGKDQQLRGVLAGGITNDGSDYFEPIEPETLSSFSVMTQQAGMLWMSRELNEEISRRNLELTELTQSYSRFVPFSFIEMLGQESIQHVNKGDHASINMDVMFADLRGFTTMAEKLGSEMVFTLLNEYLAEMEPCIANSNGFINQYQGDGIMALFSGGSDNAVIGVIDMFRSLDELNLRREKRSEEQLRIGVGLHSGHLLLGAIGSETRLDSNVIGDTANLASRIENMTKVYGARCLVSDSTFAALEDPARYHMRELDRVIVAGKSEPVVIYELMDVDSNEVRDQKLQAMGRFAEGLETYRQGNFHEGRLVFADCLVRAPLDEAAALYIGRCVNLITQPPVGRWDGTTVLKGK